MQGESAAPAATGTTRRRRDSLEAEALDAANEASNARFTKRHQRMGLTITAALVLFTIGSVRGREGGAGTGTA